MKTPHTFYAFTTILFLSAQFSCDPAVKDFNSQDSGKRVFHKICIDSTFRSEAVVAADLNNDDLIDIVVGDVWYEAPTWTKHEIRNPGTYTNKTYSSDNPEELPYYSNSFGVYAIDVNHDAWLDVLTFPTMGKPIVWHQNPGTTNKHWNKGIAVQDYHGESPLLVDLFGSGISGILCGVNEADSLYQLGYTVVEEPGIWKTTLVGRTSTYSYDGPFWGKRIKHAAAGAFAHGLGTGDINGDGYLDIVTRNGWYEGAEQTELPFQFNEIPFDTMASSSSPNLQFAQLLVYDVDLDGDSDVIGSSAHQYGIWWFEQVMKNGRIDFIKHIILDELSQAHALALGDLNQNGIPDFVTGKRYLAHNGRDPGWDDPVELLWIEAYQLTGETKFSIVKLDEGVGVGTQISLSDMNSDGWDDILISNKKGTFLFTNKPSD